MALLSLLDFQVPVLPGVCLCLVSEKVEIVIDGDVTLKVELGIWPLSSRQDYKLPCLDTNVVLIHIPCCLKNVTNLGISSRFFSPAIHVSFSEHFGQGVFDSGHVGSL